MSDSLVTKQQLIRSIGYKSHQQLLNPEKVLRSSHHVKGNFNSLKSQLCTIKQSMDNIVNRSQTIISNTSKTDFSSQDKRKGVGYCRSCLLYMDKIKSLQGEKQRISKEIINKVKENQQLKKQNKELAQEVRALSQSKYNQQMAYFLSKQFGISQTSTITIPKSHKKLSLFQMQEIQVQASLETKQKDQTIQIMSMRQAQLFKEIQDNRIIIENYKQLFDETSQEVIRLKIQKMNSKYENNEKSKVGAISALY